MAVKPVSCQMGALLTDGMTATIHSLSNADAVINIGGQAIVVDMTTKFCDDRNDYGAGVDLNGDNHVCYIGIQIITGLSPLTKYDWTVSQDGNVDVGFQWTSTTKKASRVAVALTTCMNMTYLDQYTTGFNFLRSYIDDPENPPLLAILHADDIAYADGSFSGLSNGGFNADGKQRTNGMWVPGISCNVPAYNFGLYYAAWMGILAPFYNVADTGFTTPLLANGLDDDFQYCKAHAAFMPSAGDHEYGNNLGWGNSMAAYPTPYHFTGTSPDFVNDGGYDGKGLQAYNEFMQHLQGESIGFNDQHSKHWFADFGSYRYIALDGTTNGVKDVTSYGTGQIIDVLNKVDGTQWWYNISAPAGGCRGGGATAAFPTYETYVDGLSGVQQTGYKNESFVQAEYNRMWRDTGQTPAALMDNSFGNGAMGMAFLSRGDWHQGLWCRWTAPADDLGPNLAAENINEIVLNSVGPTAFGGTYFLGDDVRDAAMAADNCQFVGAISDVGVTNKPSYPIITIIEIDGEKATPEMIVRQWCCDTPAETGVSEIEHFTNKTLQTKTDRHGNLWRVVAERRFVRHTGNEGYTLDEDPWQYKKISSGSE